MLVHLHSTASDEDYVYHAACHTRRICHMVKLEQVRGAALFLGPGHWHCTLGLLGQAVKKSCSHLVQLGHLTRLHSLSSDNKTSKE